MRLQFAARIELDNSYKSDHAQNRRNVEDVPQGLAIRQVLAATDSDIVVSIRPRGNGQGGSEALVHIDKPEAQLPKALKKYASPQKFIQFYAKNLHETGEFSGTAYRLGNLRSVIMDKIFELHLALHPSQPLGLKNQP